MNIDIWRHMLILQYNLQCKAFIKVICHWQTMSNLSLKRKQVHTVTPSQYLVPNSRYGWLTVTYFDWLNLRFFPGVDPNIGSLWSHPGKFSSKAFHSYIAFSSIYHRNVIFRMFALLLVFSVVTIYQKCNFFRAIIFFRIQYNKKYKKIEEYNFATI